MSHPAVAVMQDADRRIKAWVAEFGMTPSARSRVKPCEERGTDAAEKYFSDYVVLVSSVHAGVAQRSRRP